MFNGRTRRQVNLRSKKPTSTHDVLKNAEAQRQKRERQRQEVAASETIQSRWRAANLLMAGRRAWAQRILEHSELSISGDELAWTIAAFPYLSRNEQVALLERYLAAPDNGRLSELLIQRLPLLWRIQDARIRALGARVLRIQDPPTIPFKLLQVAVGPGMESSLLEWVASKNPEGLLHVLLELNSADLVKQLSDTALVHLYRVSAVPVSHETSLDTLNSLLRRVLPDAQKSWPLIFKLVTAMKDRQTRNPVPYTSEFCDQTLLAESLKRSPTQCAEYILALLKVFPKSKPAILLQLSLATSPSPLSLFWSTYKSGPGSAGSDSLLHICTEMYSYWLLVSTDAELLCNTSLGLSRQDLWDFTVTVRDRSFDYLWNYYPKNRVRVSGPIGSILKVLRQIYTRDTRMKLFPADFWLMDTIPQSQFLQQIETSDSLYGLGNGPWAGDRSTYPSEEDEGEDEDEEDEDDIDGTDGPSDTTPKKDGLLLNGYEDASYSIDRLKDTKIVLKSVPALRILELAPFFVPFETRVALFYRYIEKDRAAQSTTFSPHHFSINRETLIEDAQLVFASLGPRVKTDLQIRLYTNNTPEAGIDGGGLTRELLTSVCEEEFHKQLGGGLETASSDEPSPLFIETLNHTLAPNPIYGESQYKMTSRTKARFLFLGQVIGKCLYENLLVDVEFAPFFLAKWNKSSANGQTLKSSFDDLSLLDHELYHNISKLHNIHGAELEALGLDFTVVNSQRHVVDLRPKGASIAVNDSNKLEFMRELANYKLNTSLRPQTMWFVLGLSQVIRLEWLNMFNPQELNKLISGESHDFDVRDMREHTEVYGFEQNSPTIANLWKLLGEFEPQQRAEFLQFITAVPRAPLLGFARLQPHLGIRYAGHDDDRLPTSSTCVNLLRLPEYSSLDILRQKLLYSIEAQAGFDLS